MAGKRNIISAVRRFQSREVRQALRDQPHLITSRDRQGRNLLHICCSVKIGAGDSAEATSSIRTADVLMAAGLDPDEPAFSEGEWKATALWYAIAHGHNLRLARHLLSRGCTPDHCLWAAVNQDSPAAIRLLLKHGAVMPEAGTPLLFTAFKWNRHASAEELLRQGVDPDLEGPDGDTVLHHVLRRGDAAAVRMLLRYGARTDIPGHDGSTALEVIRRKRAPEWRRLAVELDSVASGQAAANRRERRNAGA